MPNNVTGGYAGNDQAPSTTPPSTTWGPQADPYTPGAVQPYQVPATASSAHEMIVAIIIMSALGMLLVILAGESPTTGNTIAAFLGLLLLVQGITHVNPFVQFVLKHPLTPKGQTS